MLTIYQIDAFTNRKFGGNPAAVCPLEEWLSDDELQAIANELNLSETAFIVPSDTADFHLRWFTPAAEVRLCGHATLATAHVLFSELGFEKETVRFSTEKAGVLEVSRSDASYTMNFPADSYSEFQPSNLDQLIDQRILSSFTGTDDLMLVLENEEAVRSCRAEFGQMKALDQRAVIITAPGDHKDFVSRVFAPNVGIDEDPVTGSAHTLLTVYWSDRLQKAAMEASQISARRGELKCELKNDRVLITGNAVTVLKGELL